jgi:hypothetical protein
MASNKLLINIALEGGKEIERQLEGIGQAGQKAFNDIGQAAAQVGGFKNLNTKEVQAGLETLGVVGPEAINKIILAVKQAGRLETLVGGIHNVMSAFASLTGAVTLFARAIAPIAIVGVGVFNTIAGSALEAAEAINKVSASAIKLGVGVEQLDRLRLGFEAAGLSAQGVTSAIETFAGVLEKVKLERLQSATVSMQELQEAAKGIGPAADYAANKLLELGNKGSQAEADLIKLGVATKNTEGNLLRLGMADPVKPGIKNLIEAVPIAVRELEKMQDSAERSALILRNFGQTAGPELILALRQGGVAIDLFIAKHGGITMAAANAAAQIEQSANRAKAAWARGDMFAFASEALNHAYLQVSQLVDRIAALVSTPIANAWQWISATLGEAAAGVGAQLAGLSNAIVMFVTTAPGDAWQWISATLGEAAAGVGAQLAGLGTVIAAIVTTPIEHAWQWIVDTFNAVIAAVIAAAEAAAAKLKQLLTGSAARGGSTGAPTGAPGGWARGGFIGGRGTGTSDSNLAWVSRGEHIMPARAVGQPGVLAFLEALRRSGGNLRRVLDGMGRFALGGPVAMPAFAGGGLNSMSNVTIQFPGLPAIGGLRASSDVVEELRKAAAMAQVRSGGRKPSRYS